MAIDFNASYTMTIGGQPVSSPETIAVVNPATEEVLATPPDATQRQLDQAVAAARKAFPSWAAKPIAERQTALNAIAARLMANVAGFSARLTRERGKPLQAARGEVQGAAHWCAEFAKLNLPVDTIE